MRIGLIGAGRVAATHAAVMRHVAGMEIVAVADPRQDAAEHLAAELGTVPFFSLSDALSSASLDAVNIVTPHDQHHPLAMQALAADVNVFMDKPIASDLTQARQMCELAASRGRVLAICHNLSFHPALRRAVELVGAGVLGTATHADAWSSGWLELPPWDFRRNRQATGGGAWVDGAPHLIYVLEDLLGPVDRLRATLSGFPSRLGGEDAAVGQAAFAAGAVATLSVGYSDCPVGTIPDWPDGWRLGVNLIGTEGRIRIDFLPRAQVSWQRKGEAKQVETLPGVEFDDGFEGAFADFVAAVDGVRTLKVTPWDSMRNLELIRSAIEG